MSEFRLRTTVDGDGEEWISLDDPVFTKVHHHRISKSSGQVRMEVYESRYPELLFLDAGYCTPDWEFVLLQFFSAIVNHYTKNGWTISNITTRSAVLTPK